MVGIGPGSREDMTLAAREALRSAQVVVGYRRYFQYVEDLIDSQAERVDTGMLQETDRAEMAFAKALDGLRVCVISSGDAGIYGMAPLIVEMKSWHHYDVPLRIIPGVSAMQKAASLLGAPLGHDFCVISLSNLLTPWSLIEQRIEAAAKADFAVAVYNPQSKDRYWQLSRLRELFLGYRAGSTPVGIVRQAGREGESVMVTTLESMPVDGLDMLTMLIVGNSQTKITDDGSMLTPRGYAAEDDERNDIGVGRNIMVQSFRTILSQLDLSHLPLGHRWCVLHAVHTTADFEMASLLRMGSDTVEKLYEAFTTGRLKTIVTDVRMVREGIRREAVRALGLQVICYLDDPR